MQDINNSQDNFNKEKSWAKPVTQDLEKGLALATQSRSYSTEVQRMQSIKEDKFIEKLAVLLSIVIFIISFPFSLLCVFVVVRQFERAIILRNGKVYNNQAFGPGLIFYLPCIDSVKFVDLRTYCYAVPPQEVLTKDSLTVSVDAVVFYKIFLIQYLLS